MRFSLVLLGSLLLIALIEALPSPSLDETSLSNDEGKGNDLNSVMNGDEAAAPEQASEGGTEGGKKGGKGKGKGGKGKGKGGKGKGGKGKGKGKGKSETATEGSK